MEERHYRHIIWDWNGTLLDDVDFCIGITNRILRQRRLPLLNRKRYCELFCFPAQKYWAALGFDFQQESFHDISSKFIEYYSAAAETCPLQPAAYSTVSALDAKGVSQSVLSAHLQDLLEQDLQQYELRRFFHSVFGNSDYYAASKLENARRLVQQLPYSPREIVLIGDTVHDFEVAAAMQIDCVLVVNGHNSAERLERCEAEVVPSLAELRNMEGLRVLHAAE